MYQPVSLEVVVQIDQLLVEEAEENEYIMIIIIEEIDDNELYYFLHRYRIDR
jgi:hypothetical protein